MKRRGFALVIAVVLLALLVLAIYALGTLSRVGSDMAATGSYQMQARQHALLGLSQAVGALQRHVASDDMLTGMGGLTGVPAGPGQPARHWCGAWDSRGAFLHWLASGAGDDILIPPLNTSNALTIVAGGSLGADGNDQEHVRVLRSAIAVHTAERDSVRLGSHAWWVGDEGVKLSSVLPAARHAIDALIGLAPDAPLLANVLSYEQVALVPASVTRTALAGQLRDNFHALGRTHLSVTGSVPVAGAFNVNTTSRSFWRGVAATYERLKPGDAAALSPAAFAAEMAIRFDTADPDAGKAASAPYASVEQFLKGATLAAAVSAGGGSVEDFAAVMRPWLAVRSDTFRVRAYGEAVNPSDASRTEATAWCEAMVQRVKEEPADSGGRFVITYFRWLGVDDI